MRAAVLHEVGDEELELRDDVQVVGPDAGEVRVRIVATGICHSDLSAMTGTIPAPPPAVLGHEGAGEVVEVGDGVDDVVVGDRVIVVWIPPCGKCRVCLGGQPNLCQSVSGRSGPGRFRFDGDKVAGGMANTGTFAEEVVLPKEAVIAFDDDVPYEIAALIGCGVTTGVGAATNTAKVTPGSSVVVFGCGGVGISVIQGARIAGAAEIVAVDPLKAKRDDAKRFGATHVASPEELTDVSAEVTGGQGFDFAFEAVGSSTTIRACYDAARRGGSAVISGVGRFDDKVEFNAFELFYMERRLLGSLYGSADVRVEFSRLLRLWRTGRLDLAGMISHRLSFEEINGGLAALRKGDALRQVVLFE